MRAVNEGRIKKQERQENGVNVIGREKLKVIIYAVRKPGGTRAFLLILSYEGEIVSAYQLSKINYKV